MPVKSDLPSAIRSSPSFGIRICLVAILTIHAAALAWGAYRHAPTVDEVAYLAAGLSHWQFGQFDLANVSPPLVRLVAAVPVLLVHPKYDWHSYKPGSGQRVAHEVGIDFIQANGRRAFWLFTVGRYGCIIFSLIGGYTCFVWAKELYGAMAGLLAVGLWCVSPSVLANGQLLSPDVGVSALGVVACFLFWRWLKKPEWGLCLKVGMALGLAELAKTNTIVFVPLWPVLWILSRRKVNDRPVSRTWSRELIQLGAILLVGLYVVNLGYLFEGSFQRLGTYVFTSKMLREAGRNRFADSWIGQIPVPLPRNYVLGLDVQKADFENAHGQRPSYLRGRWHSHGWWWYYFYVLAVKGPLGLWGLVFLSTGVHFCRRLPEADWRDDLTLLGPAVAMFGLASSQMGFSHHLRYVLPVLPFVFIWASQVASAATFRRRSGVIFFTSSGLVFWLLSSSIWIWPHSLAYFNEFAGGPHNGHFHLLESNIDWGEDLLYLREWIDSHPNARPLFVAYWGIVDPKLAGVDFAPPTIGASGESAGRHRLQNGWYAISVKCLRGDDRFGLAGCEPFLRLKPVDNVGYSILVYRINGAAQVLP